ncbi:MAG: hypothetical protein E7665_10405 [Ruminococcaceae bacterium]|nr:hypothetical protein [Oscillospiraceae bacterium]
MNRPKTKNACPVSYKEPDVFYNDNFFDYEKITHIFIKNVCGFIVKFKYWCYNKFAAIIMKGGICMRKKYISMILILILTVACISGCSTENNSLNQENSNFTETQTQIVYMTFEECLAAATHVVSATYKGEYETHGIYKDLVFAVNEQYKGTDIPNEFHLRVCNQTVSVTGTGISYATSANDYKIDETYLLVLEKHISVYYPYDVYLALGNIKITEDDAVMYEGSSVKTYSEKLDTTSSYDVTDYIKNNIKDTAPPAAQGTEFIRDSSLENVIDKTSVIAVVTPTELIGGSANNNTSRCLCTVNEVIKGTLNKNSIKIIFEAGTVELNCEYVVMLEQLGTFYILSSRNSVHNAETSNMIQQVKDMISIH